MSTTERISIEREMEKKEHLAFSDHDGTSADNIDPIAEKKLVRKLDRYIIPYILITYLLGFLDRVNIGNARLFGLEADLGLVKNQYQIAVSLLFILYILVE